MHLQYKVFVHDRPMTLWGFVQQVRGELRNLNVSDVFGWPTPNYQKPIEVAVQKNHDLFGKAHIHDISNGQNKQPFS